MTGWWTMQQAALIGGFAGGGLGVLGAILGVVMGIYGRRGRARALVYAVHFFGASIGIACLAGGLTALALGQPYHVWFPLLNLGAVGTPIFVVLFFAVTRRVYTMAEQRKLDAALLRGA